MGLTGTKLIAVVLLRSLMGCGNKQNQVKLGGSNTMNRQVNNIGAKMTNSFINKRQLPSLPAAQIGANKKTYKCSECSTQSFGKVIAYGMHSTNGAVRPYNEDRVVEYH